MYKIRSIDTTILESKEISAIKTLLFLKLGFKDLLNKETFNATIGFMHKSILIGLCFQDDLFHFTALQYFSSFLFLFTYSSSYLVLIIISYFKSRFRCQFCMDSVVCLSSFLLLVVFSFLQIIIVKP